MTQDAPRKIVGVARESFPGERRVALVPAQVAVLAKAGFDVLVERAAGTRAGYLDDEYARLGAELIDTREAVFQRADIVCQVRAAGANRHAGAEDFKLLRDGQTLIGMCDPLGQPEIMQNLAGRGVSIFALELLPRITRAQSMDVLSSMASVAGYKAVLTAATLLPRMFPMMMTAAGTITPGRVFVLGAGVAGLQAIATAKRLGAVVWSYDIRPAVKEEVLSLGAKFLELNLVKSGEDKQSGGYAQQMDEEFYRKQREAMTKQIADSDVIITTAAVPGRKAPILVTEEMVKGMPPGSVIVDIAAEQGGNCELTKANEVIVEHGVTIDGTINLPATVPYHTSQMYAKNVVTFLLHLQKENALDGESEDEIVRDTLVTRGGAVVNPRVREALGLTPPSAEASTKSSASENEPVAAAPADENADTASEETSPEQDSGQTAK
ncbi:MAG: Re/Si-specific NAD(P)(+) transhydrogenase subunit alpha [Planctomycetota bacterium]|nr:Re/Si-specific NAD(P)(+) transhydrogenase subunit alpha [Planctomycetota bacterium]MDA1249037.1 Re/Si-specific NAD(P)(+) transhydrogenase subunit alpha [Planctomycetota bacterium]